MATITPHLWLQKDAEEAAEFWCSIFPNSRIIRTQKLDGTPDGTVTSIVLEVLGQRVMLLEAGPHFELDEAFSFYVECEDQAEVDEYWDKLLAGGGQPTQCGWLRDKFGVPWQVIPKILDELLADEDKEKADRVMQAMLQMVKIETDELLAAAEDRVPA